MPLPSVNFDATKTIIPRKSYAAFKALQADGVTYAATSTDLIGKMLNMEVTTEDVRREIPDANGYLRPDRIEVTKMSNVFKFESEDVKSIAALFGAAGLAGGMITGKVLFFVVDPKDAATKCAVKSNEFKCILKLDGGLNLNAGEVAKVTLTFEALEAVNLTIDATA